MKRNICILLSMLFFVSCSLDRFPQTTLTDNDFWKSEKDLRGACNKLYIDLPGFSHDQRSDELFSNTQNNISSSNRTVPETSGDWTNPYNKIGICNNIILKGEKVSLEQDEKNRWLAEAYFFRAYHYFDLVKKYGDVPLILKAFNSTNDPEIKKGRDPREMVIQQCYSDLEFAATWLPAIDEIPEEDWGRVSRSAALGMIVRIGLYEGTHKKYHQTPNGDYKAHLKKCIDAAEKMIYEDKKHSLYPDFYDLFQLAGEGRQNKENVFVKIYGPVGVLTHDNSVGLESVVALSRNILDQFLYIDGLPKEKSSYRKDDVHYNDIFDNKEPRFAMTIFKKDEQAYKGVYLPFEATNNNHAWGYPIKKGFILSDYQTGGVVDKMIIRYAEILISYAEALYEYNGGIISDEKLDETINTVRRRVGFDVKLTNEFVQANQLDMLEEIRRERIIEFIDEGLHYDDIIRWKTAEKVLPTNLLGLVYNPDDTSKTEEQMKGKITEENGMFDGEKIYDQANIYVQERAESREFDPKRDYLYPIPTYEIATSGGNIKQNPYWNGNNE